jgi:hypothetical protein
MSEPAERGLAMPKTTKQLIAKPRKDWDEAFRRMHQQEDDVLDLQAFERRAKEQSRPFEKVLQDLKRDGILKSDHRREVYRKN